MEKSKGEKSVEVTKMTKNYINTETEEATNMGADTEAIGIEAQSGLLKHVAWFHVNGAAVSKHKEEEKNIVEELESMSWKATDTKNSEAKGVNPLPRNKQ